MERLETVRLQAIADLKQYWEEKGFKVDDSKITETLARATRNIDFVNDLLKLESVRAYIKRTGQTVRLANGRLGSKDPNFIGVGKVGNAQSTINVDDFGLFIYLGRSFEEKRDAHDATEGYFQSYLDEGKHKLEIEAFARLTLKQIVSKVGAALAV